MPHVVGYRYKNFPIPERLLSFFLLEMIFVFSLSTILLYPDRRAGQFDGHDQSWQRFYHDARCSYESGGDQR
jgi:hypothetical protein